MAMLYNQRVISEFDSTKTWSHDNLDRRWSCGRHFCSGSSTTGSLQLSSDAHLTFDMSVWFSVTTKHFGTVWLSYYDHDGMLVRSTRGRRWNAQKRRRPRGDGNGQCPGGPLRTLCGGLPVWYVGQPKWVPILVRYRQLEHIRNIFFG